MRRQPVLIALLLAVAVTARAEITSADIVGKWITGTSQRGVDNWFTFRADRSFEYAGGDMEGAGKWKLYNGKKLKLIYYSDYERKIISGSSMSDWIIIESFSKTRMRVKWLSSSDIWTKRH